MAALLACVFSPGCSRYHFRERADKDVEGVITQKNIFPGWQVTNWHVYPDPRARFADQFNPDRPPYPPDDPAARLLSPNPQRPTKKSGVGRVDGEGYLGLLQQWDAENRLQAGLIGEATRQPAAAATIQQQAATSPGLSPTRKVIVDQVRVNSSEMLDVERRFTRRHVPLPGTPAAFLSTHGKRLPAGQSAMLVGGVKRNEFGPWVASHNSSSAPVNEPLRLPTITEHRSPLVLPGDGNVEPESRVLPAGGLDQVPNTQPEPLPLPRPIVPLVPAEQPKVPAGPGLEGGDPAVDYLRALESGEMGFRIKLEQAVELGLINSREFQDRREDLYLAALPVTLARFNFAAQAFFTEQVIRRSTGRELAGGGEAWNFNTLTGFGKLFPTGALLLVQLANQVVIDLSGDNPTVAVSNLSLSLVQPFLRGGGKAVTLENLTLAERNLLYAIRSYARFRKIYFVAIAAGGNYTNNPYGLQGLSPNLGRGIGGNLTAPSVGYLQLLQFQAIINNQRRNVEALERLLRLYQAFREGGQQSPLQVGQVEVQLLNSRGNLLGSGAPNSPLGIRGYLDALDSFKLQLGLPLTVPLELDDTPLRPIREQLARFDELFAQARVLEVDGSQYARDEAVAEFRKRWLRLFTDAPLTRGTSFAKEIGIRWAEWSPEKLTDDQARKRLSKLREDRRQLLDERVKRELLQQPEPPAEVKRLADLTSDIELGEFELRVRDYEAQPWAKRMGRDREITQDAAFTAAFNAFYLVVLGAQNERLQQLQENWPRLLPLPVEGIDVLEASLDEAYAAGIQAALNNRLDLMNARAQVVDAWRNIAITANSLQGVFDVRYDLNSSTPPGGSRPFAFSGDRSSHQLSFRADLPLVRRAERNNYRAALVAYQRQRRLLMAFEDNIANDVRGDVRQLRTLAQLYRIQQRTVELGYAQVDNAQAILFAPPIPGAGSDAGSAAALTQQVLQTQNSLLQAQNTLYQLWVQYLTARMNLYLDLEQMPLDERGVWCDELFNGTNRPDQPDLKQPRELLHTPLPVGDGEKR